MSTRQIRRFLEQKAKEDPKETHSDESDEFVPNYAKKEPKNNTFKDLFEVEDGDEQSQPPDSDSEFKGKVAIKLKEEATSEKQDSDSDNAACIAAEKRKSKRSKKKKKKNAKKNLPERAVDSPDSDEVERAVAEVNEMLGSTSMEPPQLTPVVCRDSVLRVDYKNLNARAELAKLIGEEGELKKTRQPSGTSKRRIIVLENRYEISFSGLSMEKVGERNGVRYFKFIHEPKYKHNLREMIESLKFFGGIPPEHENFPVDTLEGFLQTLDVYFYAEESSMASHAMEGTITYVQTVFAPSFGYFDGKTRLEYKYVENRPFHILLLKYIHLLTNKACHRTALEIAKLLLNLDPSDPLALIFIIDIIAIRARRFEWLLELYDKWYKERDAGRLFNILYSRALAMYNMHVKTKSDEDLVEANKCLRAAIIAYPNIAITILEKCRRNVSELTAHPVYELAKTTTPAALHDLESLHCTMIWPKWREPKGSLEWVTNIFKEVCNDYDRGTRVKDDVEMAASERNALFRKHPIQVKRHLFSIQSMAQLIADGNLPTVERTIAFNPYPDEDESVDVNGYYLRSSEARLGYLRRFLISLLPDNIAEDHYNG